MPCKMIIKQTYPTLFEYNQMRKENLYTHSLYFQTIQFSPKPHLRYIDVNIKKSITFVNGFTYIINNYL